MNLNLIIFFLVCSFPLHARLLDEVQYSLATADAQKNNWEQAEQRINKLLVNTPDRPDLLYDAGVIAHRNKKFEQAHACFEHGLQCPDVKPSLQEQLCFNAGNTCVELQQLKEAINYYEKVLALNNKHERARHNLEVVKNMLKQEEQEKKQQQEQEQKNNQNNEQQKQNQDQGNNNQNNDQKKDEKQKSQEQQGENNQRKNDKQQSESKNQGKEKQEKQDEQENGTQKQNEGQRKQGGNQPEPRKRLGCIQAPIFFPVYVFCLGFAWLSFILVTTHCNLADGRQLSFSAVVFFCPVYDQTIFVCNCLTFFICGFITSTME